MTYVGIMKRLTPLLVFVAAFAGGTAGLIAGVAVVRSSHIDPLTDGGAGLILVLLGLFLLVGVALGLLAFAAMREKLAVRTEAKAVRDQVLKDRLRQESGAGHANRSSGS